MMIERQLEAAFAERLRSMPEMADAYVVSSREPAPRGETKSEGDARASVVAVACGFRQNDAFSLSPVTMQMSVSVVTRAEMDPTSGKHDAAVEAVADLLSRWHKYGEEMSEALTTDKFLAGELRMEGGTPRVYDSAAGAWSETLTFAVRGSEKFPSPAPFFPDNEGIKMSDGVVLPVGAQFYSTRSQDITMTLQTLGYRVNDVSEIYVFSPLLNVVPYKDYMKAVYVDSACTQIGGDAWSAPFSGGNLEKVVFRGRTLEEVQAMDYYPWGLSDTSRIQVIS